MHFNIKNKMLEVCLLHTPTFIIEPLIFEAIERWLFCMLSFTSVMWPDVFEKLSQMFRILSFQTKM